jgi:hypothetical protein
LNKVAVATGAIAVEVPERSRRGFDDAPAFLPAFLRLFFLVGLPWLVERGIR